MENSTKCPVCGKEGIPDFLQEAVVCPCCNSDLGIYRQIQEVSSQTKKPHTIFKLCLSGLCIVTIALAILLVWELTNSQSKDTQRMCQIQEMEIQIETLKDSINLLKSATIPELPIKDSNKSAIYIVKKGDSFCKISKCLYGTEMRYDEIVELNNLTKNSIIHQGDTLKILVE